MTNQAIKTKIDFFTNVYLNTVKTALEQNRNGLICGKMALKIAGCPDDVAQEIQRLTLKELNK